MKRMLAAVGIIFLVGGVFFKDVILAGKVLVPGDIVTGMYYPWLGEKWGYEVGVPVKNPIISDVVSTVYIWKTLVAEAYRQGGLPLWNLYSYSGYPLLANFQSGAVYPLNILMVWLGDIPGWNVMLMFGSIGAAMAVFFYLKNRQMSNLAAAAAGITYAFSSYAVTWMEFVTVAQMMVWFPLMFLCADLAASGKGLWRWMWPGVLFLAITAGRFEVLVYMLVALGMYAAGAAWSEKKWKWLLEFVFLGALGIGLGAVQIWPTVEMGLRSVRFNEVYIEEQRWGLISPVQVITGLAPDFFGNPATGNYWGKWHYHETVFYAGVVAAVAIFAAGFGGRHLGKYKFFFGMVIAALMLGTDNPIAVGMYKLKQPVMSTVSAGRIFVLYVFGAAVLVGWWIDNIKKFSKGEMVRFVGYPLLVVAVMAGTAGGLKMWLVRQAIPLPELQAQLMIAVRNSVLPFLILAAVTGGLVFRKTKYFAVILIMIIAADLTRAGWKYLPMVEEKLVFPKEEVINFLMDKNKDEVFRIDREHGEIMPPNMWAAYRLSSPSGYDPLAQKEYVAWFSRELNFTDPVFSRYSELGRYDAAALGKYNVKYLLAIKRDEKRKIPGNIINEKIDLREWKTVAETAEVAVLENSKYQERVRTEGPGRVEVSKNEPGRVAINYEGMQPGQKLILAESYYPGWKVCEEKVCVEVGQEEAFMSGRTKGQKGEMVFVYRPKSVRNGLAVTMACLMIWGGYVIWKNRQD